MNLEKKKPKEQSPILVSLWIIVRALAQSNVFCMSGFVGLKMPAFVRFFQIERSSLALGKFAVMVVVCNSSLVSTIQDLGGLKNQATDESAFI